MFKGFILLQKLLQSYNIYFILKILQIYQDFSELDSDNVLDGPITDLNRRILK